MGSYTKVLVELVLAAAAIVTVFVVASKYQLLVKTTIRSVRGHLKQGLSVALTAAVATMVFAGALVVGDSMEALVEETATSTLPGIDSLIRTSHPLETGHFTKLIGTEEWQANVSKTAMMLTIPAAVTCDRTGLRDGQATLYGFQDSIFGLTTFYRDGDERTVHLYRGEVAINRHLARELGATEGDNIDLRVPDPTFQGDFLFLFEEDAGIERNFHVKAVFDDEGLGRLDPEAKRVPSSTVFMDLGEAQELLGSPGEVNLVAIQYRDGDLVGTRAEGRLIESLEGKLDRIVGASAAGLELVRSPGGWDILVSERVFIDGALEAPLSAGTEAWSPALVYFVDSLDGGGAEDLAYSSIAGIDFDLDRQALGDWVWDTGSPVTVPTPGSNEVLLNNWTADVLGVGPGDTIHVGYTVVDEGYDLVERSVDLQVVGVVDLEGKAADPALLPPIPGIHNQMSCLDWEPPFPMDLETIEDEDIDYWNEHRGTPKAWIDLGTARELWTNPDGDWTGARFVAQGGLGNGSLAHFDDAVSAADAGIAIVPARAQALATGGPLEVFEQMFLAFGVVLLVAGCLLMSSAFMGLVRARLREHATLRALGVDRPMLWRLLMLEGLLWGIIAGIIGTVAGAALGSGLVWGLNNAWAASVEGTAIPLSVRAGTLGIAFLLGLVVTLATISLAANRAAKTHIASALSDRTGGAVEAPGFLPPRKRALLGVALFIVPAVVGAALRPSTDVGGIALFFTAGILAAVGAALASVPFIKWLEGRVKLGPLAAPWRMGLRSIRRRPMRTLTLVTTFAVVTFAVVGMAWAGEVEIAHAGEFRAEQTGGYDVLAETWVPVGGSLEDHQYAPPGDWSVTSVKVVGHQGGTCSNLNARFPPRVMGLPDEFLENVTVGFRSSSVDGDRETWLSLGTTTGAGRVPIVVDYNTLVWIYGGELGDVYEVTGDRGKRAVLEVVGVMEGSIFGGSFLTGLDNMNAVYPDSAEFTYFLFDSGSSPPEELARSLEGAFGDLGLDARTTEDVLRDNLAYEMSFLRLFRAYLALGLVLGAAGLGALAIRQVAERRREVGAMRALGWTRIRVGLTFLSEQMWIALIGVVAGILGATVSVVATTPGWLGSLSDVYFPGGVVATIAAAVVLAAMGGALWAAWEATRMKVVDALRVVD